MNLTYTVENVLAEALSNIGVDYYTTEAANREHAHRNMNLLLGLWAADPDMAIGKIVPLSGYAELDDTVALPTEYIMAIVLNLAVALSPHYDQKADATLVSSAEGSLNIIRTMNIRRTTGSIPTNKLA